MLAFLKSQLDPLSIRDKLLNGVAASLAILCLGFSLQLLPHKSFVLPLMVSMGASTFLLFVVPHSPMAQPWSLIGGHVVSAAVGVGCAHATDNALLAGGGAVGAAVVMMQWLRCHHPPGAATALAVAMGGATLQHADLLGTVYAVAGNATILGLMAVLFNALILRRRYPMRHSHHPHHAEFQQSHAPTPFDIDEQDVEWALGQMDGIVDVSKEDLIDIYELALERAMSRRERRGGNGSQS